MLRKEKEVMIKLIIKSKYSYLWLIVHLKQKLRETARRILW
jgi:hypothetical protein